MRRYELTTSPFSTFFDGFLNDFPAVAPQWPEAHRFAEESVKWAQFRTREEENGVVVEAELAGVKKEDLKNFLGL